MFAVREMRNVAGYEFWPDDVSLLDTEVFDANALMGPAQVIDSYLLALAVKRDALLVTLDTRLMLSAVTGPQPGICIRKTSAQLQPNCSGSVERRVSKRRGGSGCKKVLAA